MKIKSRLFAITFMILHVGYLNGQTHERCHSSYLHQEQQADPSMLQQRQAIEASIQGILDNDPNFRVSGGVVTIPVVFHVLYNTPSENISMAKIQSQLDVLNRDFRKLNSDTATMPSVWAPLIGDAEIEFCLATTDPIGNPTNGVTRTATSVTTFAGYTDMKYNATGGKDAWPRDDYMNVWVCDLFGYTAFGQFPGFAAATDGVAIDYQAFGTIGNVIGSGRLMVHEAGHWLHLYHIWGDDFFLTCASDSVSDTPPQEDWSNGCPTFPQYDACSGTGSGTMFMNYMDYTNDGCMNSFTNGQVARMHAALQVLRPGILTSTKCDPINIPPIDAAVAVINHPSGTFCDLDITPEFILGNFGSDPLTSCTINYQLDAGNVQTINWTGNLPSLNNETVFLPTITPLAGPHTLDIWVSNPNGGIDGGPSNDLKSTSFTNSYPPSGWTTPISEGFESGFFPPYGWSIENPDFFFTWERVTGTSGYGVGQASASMNGFDYGGFSQFDYFNLPVLDLSVLQVTEMSFDVAYSLYNSSAFVDSLAVQVSTNCGNTWTNIYSKGGQDLATTTPAISGSEFIPTANDWRTEVLDLSPFANKPSVMIRFRNRNNHQNNLYLDNVNVNGLVGVEAPTSNDIELYPNPAKDRLVLAFSNSLEAETSIRVLNSLGQIMKTIEPQATGEVSLDLDIADLVPGVYFLELRTSEGNTVKKFIKSR